MLNLESNNHLNCATKLDSLAYIKNMRMKCDNWQNNHRFAAEPLCDNWSLQTDLDG